MSAGGVFALAALALVGWVAYEVLAKKKAIGEAAAKVGNAINPLSDQNVANKAVNAVVESVTGVKDDTLGGLLWRLANPGQEAKDNQVSAPTGPNVPTEESLAEVYAKYPSSPQQYMPWADVITSNPAGAAVGRTMKP